jgi:hypothetical protein
VTRVRFRLVDTAGSEIGIVPSDTPTVGVGDTVQMPDGRPVEVVDVYDDEFGREGGVQATLVVDDGDDVASGAPLAEERALHDLVDRLGLRSRLDEIEALAQRLRDHVQEGRGD